MIETKHCQAGSHNVPVYSFGRDASKTDGLSIYCKDCVNNTRQNERDEKYADRLRSASDILELNKSESAIERNRLKRAEEAMIEEQLRAKEREVDVPPSKLWSLALSAVFGSSPKKFRRAYEIK